MTRVLSLAAHFESASQLSDFSKFGIGSGLSSPESWLESSVLPSGRRADGHRAVECGLVEGKSVVVMEQCSPDLGVKVDVVVLCLE